MKKSALFIVVLLVLVGGYYLYDKNSKNALAPIESEDQLRGESGQKEDAPQQPGSQASGTPSQTPTGNPPAAAGAGTEVSGHFSTGEELEGPDILVVEVGYDGQKFNPDTVSIKAGDIVIFRNNSGKDFWPASAPHPTHTAYPEFDAKTAIAPKGKFQFKFEKAGQWAYHDHLNPSATGVINVSGK